MGEKLRGTRAFRHTVQDYAQAAHKHHFASLLLIVVVLLTHFYMGSLPIAPGFSYADAVCLASIAGAVAVLCAQERLSDARTRNRALRCATACAALFFVLMQTVSFAIPEQALRGVSAAAMGVYISLVAVFWFDYFIDESMETCAFSLSICLTGGCALSWFLLGMSQDRFIVGYTLAIFLAGFLLELALRSKESGRAASPGEAGRAYTAKSPDGFGHAAALLGSIFLLCFAAMLSLAYVGTQSWHSNELWLVVLPAVLIVSSAALFFEKMETGALLYIALILAVASVLLSSFFDLEASFLFMLATNELVITVSLSILFMLALAKKQTQAPPRRAGALLLLVMFFGCICGKFAGDFTLQVSISHFQEAVAIAVVVALIACVSVALSSKSLARVVHVRFSKTQAQEEDRILQEENRLKAFAEEKGLGAREYEALCLLAEGCSAKEVAERMFVANGTAKAHIRHVYQKLDVNNRESLLEVVENARKTGALHGSGRC